MLEVGLFDLITALCQCWLLQFEPLIGRNIEQLWTGTFLETVIAFLQLAPSGILRRAGHLFGASLSGLADLLAAWDWSPLRNWATKSTA